MTDGSNVRGGTGPRIDPDAMPPEELARLRAEGYGSLVAHRVDVDYCECYGLPEGSPLCDECAAEGAS